jgi:hypothetical protein
MKCLKLNFIMCKWRLLMGCPNLNFLANIQPIFGRSIYRIFAFSTAFSLVPPMIFAQSSPRIQFQSAFKDYNTCIIPEGPLDSPTNTFFTAQNIRATIPTNLKPTKDAGEIATKFGDQALQNWLNSEAVKSSSLGRRATQVENAMRTEIVVNKDSKNDIDHRFSLQFMALQVLTKLEYKGWLNASLNYDAKASETEFEVKDKIWNKKEIFVNHKTTPIEGQSTMGVRWDW